MRGRGFGASVGDGQADEDVFLVTLGVLDLDVEVALFVEGSGVEELVFELVVAAFLIGFNEFGVGEGALGVLVEGLGVGVGGGGVEVVELLLDVLAVVSFGVAEAEEAFLEDGVLPVPEGGAVTEADTRGRSSRGGHLLPSGRAR